MLVWLNGPFGAGKTQTAFELHRRLPGSVVCDPEYVGFGLHRTMPPELRADFQDLRSWRLGVVEVLDLTLRSSDAVVIAPMTLVDPRYFDEIVGELRRRGHDVQHFALVADRDTVVRRLRERAFGRAIALVAGSAAQARRESFALANLDRCLDALRGPQFAEQIWTDRLTVGQVADHIAAAAGLTLTPNTDSPIRGRLRRAWTGARHVRLR